MKDIFESLPVETREQLKKTEQPAWIEPMLATLTDAYFSDEGWLFERKLDGENHPRRWSRRNQDHEQRDKSRWPDHSAIKPG